MNLLCLLPVLVMVTAKLECNVIKIGDPELYNLAMQTVKMTQRKDSKVFQVFDCTCPDMEGRNVETFGDDDKDEFDTDYYKKDEVDWAESQLMRVADCDKLVVNLGANSPNALHKTVSLSKVTILIM